MLIAKSLEEPLGRVWLIHRPRSIRFQDRLDHRENLLAAASKITAAAKAAVNSRTSARFPLCVKRTQS